MLILEPRNTDRRRVYIKSFGCQMNVYDSERMAEILTQHGYAIVFRSQDADIILLNTCHIREKASEKVYSELGRLNSNPATRSALVGVAGCLAQAEGEEIVRRVPSVKFVVGPQNYHALPEILQKVIRARGGRTDVPIDLELDAVSKFDALDLARRQNSSKSDTGHAFLTVQEGCDKFCSFCVVPYTRGSEVSRSVDSITSEARQLVERGVCALTLLGQNVNAYHGADQSGRLTSLGQLLFEVARISGVGRLSYTTSHPVDMHDDLFNAHRDLPQLMPYLHLPIQSGSDQLLRAMLRRHSVDDFRKIVGDLKSARPDIALSSDFIVGFPGESDADFRATLDVIDEFRFSQAFAFRYSPRPGTPAALLEDREGVEDHVKRERLLELQDTLRKWRSVFDENTCGKTMNVLLDRPGNREGELLGRSDYMQTIAVQAPSDLSGHLVRVKVLPLRDGRLFATALNPDRPAFPHVASGRVQPFSQVTAGDVPHA